MPFGLKDVKLVESQGHPASFDFLEFERLVSAFGSLQPGRPYKYTTVVADLADDRQAADSVSRVVLKVSGPAGPPPTGRAVQLGYAE